MAAPQVPTPRRLPALRGLITPQARLTEAHGGPASSWTPGAAKGASAGRRARDAQSPTWRGRWRQLPACLLFMNSKLVVWPQRHFLPEASEWRPCLSSFSSTASCLTKRKCTQPNLQSPRCPSTRDRKGPCLHGHPSGQRAQGPSWEGDRPLA